MTNEAYVILALNISSALFCLVIERMARRHFRAARENVLITNLTLAALTRKLAALTRKLDELKRLADSVNEQRRDDTQDAD